MLFHRGMDKPSPLTSSSAPMAVLPPHAARGANAPAVNTQDFRALLATQGVKPPAGDVPTTAEAQIEAAQIAAKANVNMGVKRGPVLTGMQQPQTPAVPAPTTERFMPLRQGPSAARTYTGSVSGAPTTSVETLRATSKFAPGPVAGPVKTVPALARPKADTAAQAMTQTTTAQVITPETTPLRAVEAYTYGLKAATEQTPAEIPAWFDDAVQNAFEKYDAMNKAKTP